MAVSHSTFQSHPALLLSISYMTRALCESHIVLHCIEMSRQCLWSELNWQQVKRVFSSPQHIWDWTVLSSPAFQDGTKLQTTKHAQFRNFLFPTVLTRRQFSSQRRHGRDKTVLCCPCRQCELGMTQLNALLQLHSQD